MIRIVARFLRMIPDKVTRFVYEQRRLLVFIMNIVIILASLLISLAIRFEFSIHPVYISNFLKIATVFVLVKMSFNHIFKLNQGLWRYISIVDVEDIFKSNIFSTAVIMIIFYNWRTYICKGFPISVIVIDFFICFFCDIVYQGRG